MCLGGGGVGNDSGKLKTMPGPQSSGSKDQVALGQPTRD